MLTPVHTLVHYPEEQKGVPQKPRPFAIASTKTFGKPPWFDNVQREYWACREAVGLADYSNFTKIDLQVSCLFDYLLLYYINSLIPAAHEFFLYTAFLYPYTLSLTSPI